MSGKVASSVKDRCTEDKKKECEKNGKICNPNSKSNDPKIYCFNNTENNRAKIEEFKKQLAKSLKPSSSSSREKTPNISSSSSSREKTSTGKTTPCALKDNHKSFKLSDRMIMA